MSLNDRSRADRTSAANQIECGRENDIHDVIAVNSFSAWGLSFLCANRIRSNWPSAKGGASVHNNALVTEASHANHFCYTCFFAFGLLILVLIFHFDTGIIYFYSPIDLLDHNFHRDKSGDSASFTCCDT